MSIIDSNRLYIDITDVLTLTGLGETCEGQWITPIDTLVDCIVITGFIQTLYRAYKFEREEEKDDCPKVCYVYLHGGRYEGYFNTDMSGGRDMNSRAVCMRLVDTKKTSRNTLGTAIFLTILSNFVNMPKNMSI